MVIGQTLEPTPADGWVVTALVVPTSQGLTVRDVKIEASPLVMEDGDLRSRTQSEYNVNINSSVMKLVDLTRIRAEYRKYLDTVTELARMHRHPETERWARLRDTATARTRGRTVNSPENMYRFSQDVIDEAQHGRGMRERLAKRWDVRVDTVKSRMRLLRAEGWIVGGSTTALQGPSLLRYQHALELGKAEGAE